MCIRLTILSFCAVLAAVGPAYAQAPGTIPPRDGENLPQDRDDKSVVSAYLLSVGATLVPMGIAASAGEGAGGPGEVAALSLAYAGLVLGPSAGHWYAGRKITTGLVLRASSLAFIAGLAVHDPQLNNVATVMGLFTGLTAFTVGQIWDLVTLPRAVRRHNRETRARSLRLTPLMGTATTGQRVAGLALGGRF